MKILIYTIAIALTLHGLIEAQEPTPMPQQYKTQLERYAGDWETEVTVNGVGYKGTFSCKMAPGSECMIYHITAPGIISTDTEITGTGILGWDPIKKCLKEVNFNSLGETSTTLWTWQDDQLQGLRDSVILGQESNSKVKNVWTKDGKSWEHHQTDWRIAGKKQDDVVRTFVTSK